MEQWQYFSLKKSFSYPNKIKHSDIHSQHLISQAVMQQVGYFDQN